MPDRVFLDWSQPLMPAVADLLLPPELSGPFELSDTLLVVPTRQAGRPLRAFLASHVPRRGGTALLSARVHPPSVFLHPEHPETVAHVFDELQAWTETLCRQDPATLPNLLPGAEGPMPPKTAMEFGRRLQRLRAELLDADLDLQAVAAAHPLASEQQRWQEMAALETQYRTRLQHLGLRDANDAKRAQAKTYTPPPGVTRIVLAGVPDPSPLVLKCLTTLETRLPVVCWIHAPETEAPHFDAWGRPDASWRERPVGPPPHPDSGSEDWIELHADPAALADRVAQVLASAPPRPDLAFGMVDDDLAPLLQDALASVDRKLYDPRPLPLAHQPPARALECLDQVRSQRDGLSLRTLWRHPDLLAALPGDPETLLTAWDRYATRHLPHSPDAVQPEQLSTDLQAAWEKLKQWIEAASASDKLAVLREIYRGVALDPDRPHDRLRQRAADTLADILREAAKREKSDRAPTPEMVMQLIRESSVDPLRVDGDVTAEGWLELGFHPAPSLLLLGMREGKVPGTRVADPFLPDTLRHELGLKSDRDWLARDAYLFHALCASRPPGHVRVLCTKRDAGGTPTPPSRLLFQCEDAALLQRARLLFSDPPPTHAPTHAAPGLHLAPFACAAKPVQRVSVTAFRSYLTCPTRFYLLRALQMSTLDDTAREPDAAAFGQLLHKVLEQAFQTPCGLDALLAHIDQTLEQEIRHLYGPNPGLAITVARHSARARLHAAARRQIELWDAGWQILHTEISCERPCGSLTVSGIIDRVDRHPEHGFRILDYKTSDSPTDPAAAHLGTRKTEYAPLHTTDDKGKEKQWVDLQLPLYRWLAETQPWFSADTPLQVGYFLLPKSVNDTDVVCWPGEAERTADARRALHFLCEQIEQGVWWPPAEKVTYDDFAPLFHYGTKGWIPPESV